MTMRRALDKLDKQLDAALDAAKMPQRWHRVIVDGTSEKAARKAYERANGPIAPRDGIILRTIVHPTAWRAL